MYSISPSVAMTNSMNTRSRSGLPRNHFQQRTGFNANALAYEIDTHFGAVKGIRVLAPVFLILTALTGQGCAGRLTPNVAPTAIPTKAVEAVNIGLEIHLTEPNPTNKAPYTYVYTISAAEKGPYSHYLNLGVQVEVVTKQALPMDSRDSLNVKLLTLLNQSLLAGIKLGLESPDGLRPNRSEIENRIVLQGLLDQAGIPEGASSIKVKKVGYEGIWLAPSAQSDGSNL